MHQHVEDRTENRVVSDICKASNKSINYKLLLMMNFEFIIQEGTRCDTTVMYRIGATGAIWKQGDDRMDICNI